MINAIITFLIQNPIVAAILLVVVIGLFIAILVSKKSFTLNFGENKSITIGGSNEKKSLEQKTLIKSCQFCKERIKIVTKTRVKSIMNLRNETLHRQMKYFENGLERTKIMLQDDYKKWLAERKPHSSDIATDLEYIVVVDKIQLCLLTRVLPGIKQMLIENHLSEKTDSEFELYKTQSILTIKADIFRFVETNFISGYSVKRDEQYRFFADRFIHISSELDRCFNQSRTLAIELTNKTSEIKSKSDHAMFDQD